jgi:hypothetical protein
MMFHPSFERNQVVFGKCIDLEIVPRPSTCEDQTGGVVWPVNHVMAKFIEDFQIPLCGRRVIELGAGTGILSIAAALQGAEVTATELPDFTSMLHTNVANNADQLAVAAAAGKGSGEVRVMGHRWGEDTSALGGPFDLVLCCELLYWGGWSLLSNDTRGPLLRSITDLTSPPCSSAAEPASPPEAGESKAGSLVGAGSGGAVLVGFAVRNAAREREFLAAAAPAFDVRYCHLPMGGGAAVAPPPAGGVPGGWLSGGSRPALHDTLPEQLEEGDVVVAWMRRRSDP